MGHLNAEAWKRLLENPRSEPELFAHLGEPCEACEAFLAGTSHALLDGVTDGALVRRHRYDDDARAEATWARIRPAPAPARAWLRWAAAVAAMLLAVAFFFFQRRAADDFGLKGGPVLTLELEAVVQQPDGVLARLERRQKVAPAGLLLLRYRASEAATAMLVVQRASGREQSGPFALEAGQHDLSTADGLVGVPLQDERGALEVWLVALPGNQAPTAAEADAALRSKVKQRSTAVGLELLIEP